MVDELGQRGILQRISDACMWDAANEIRYKQANGTVELLTSIIPIRATDGCWVLTSTRWWVEGEQYLGRIAVRHELNDFLREVGGHIGYDVRPSARRPKWTRRSR